MSQFFSIHFYILHVQPTRPCSPLPRMSAFAQHSRPHAMPRPPPPSASLPDISSPLDLLSRVALGQYPHPQCRASSQKPPLEPPAQPTSLHAHLYTPPTTTTTTITTTTNTTTTTTTTTPPPPDYSSPTYSSVSSDDPPSSSRLPRSQPHIPLLHPSSRPHKLPRLLNHQLPVSRSRCQPSRFCHICSRTSKKVGLLACANFATGACRKVVCQKCFADHNWDWDAAFQMAANWICTHCRHQCPDRAQCAIYKRTNERRREQQQQQRWNKSEQQQHLPVDSLPFRSSSTSSSSRAAAFADHALVPGPGRPCFMRAPMHKPPH